MVKALRWVDGGAVGEAVERIHGWRGGNGENEDGARQPTQADGTRVRRGIGVGSGLRQWTRSQSWPSARWALASPPLSRASCSFRSTRRVLLSVVSLVRLSASEIRASVNAPRRVLVAALRLAASLAANHNTVGEVSARIGS